MEVLMICSAFFGCGLAGRSMLAVALAALEALAVEEEGFVNTLALILSRTSSSSPSAMAWALFRCLVTPQNCKHYDRLAEQIESCDVL